MLRQSEKSEHELDIRKYYGIIVTFIGNNNIIF